MRILLTGGAGFIGSHFVRSLLGGQYPEVPLAQLTVLDVLGYGGNTSNLAAVWDDQRLTFVHGDIRDEHLIGDILPGHDTVVHLAAETHVDRSIAEASAFVNTNVLGTQVLLQAAVRNGVRRFLHVSTDEVYGSITSGSWTESHPLAPRSPYSASKAGSDLMALAYHATYGLDVVVTRCSNNYGPHQFPEKLIPRFVTRLLNGNDVPLYGDGENVREWLHVSDHCRGLAAVLTRGAAGETYHIGGGTELTNRQVVGHLLDACDASWERVRQVPDRRGHDRRYALNYSKISRSLGYRPQVNFAEGLAETVEWYRTNRAWWSGLEIG
ncbi:dTDP-glucose 4,6-dehydratase [Streptomyces sp. NPDC058067]|uniref:dTDP-glucose 4,6-dehydratase n=1 Tax=Streptomyces sp. NPDC058067 TaxID=3346324 RepID=UPI0036DFB0BA